MMCVAKYIVVIQHKGKENVAKRQEKVTMMRLGWNKEQACFYKSIVKKSNRLSIIHNYDMHDHYMTVLQGLMKVDHELFWVG